jgi:hypothetical protein
MRLGNACIFPEQDGLASLVWRPLLEGRDEQINQRDER